MRYAIILAPDAVEDLRDLKARRRATVTRFIERIERARRDLESGKGVRLRDITGGA